MSKRCCSCLCQQCIQHRSAAGISEASSTQDNVSQWANKEITYSKAAMDQLHHFSRQGEMKEIKSKFRWGVSFHMLGMQESQLNQLSTDLQLPAPKWKSHVATMFPGNDHAGAGGQMAFTGSMCGIHHCPGGVPSPRQKLMPQGSSKGSWSAKWFLVQTETLEESSQTLSICSINVPLA